MNSLMNPQTLKDKIFKVLFPEQYVTDKVNKFLSALLPELIEFVRSERTEFTFNLGNVDYEYAGLLVTKLRNCNLSTEVVFKSGTAKVTVYTADHADTLKRGVRFPKLRSAAGKAANANDNNYYSTDIDNPDQTALGSKLIELKNRFGLSMRDSIYKGVSLLYLVLPKIAAGKQVVIKPEDIVKPAR